MRTSPPDETTDAENLPGLAHWGVNAFPTAVTTKPGRALGRWHLAALIGGVTLGSAAAMLLTGFAVTSAWVLSGLAVLTIVTCWWSMRDDSLERSAIVLLASVAAAAGPVTIALSMPDLRWSMLPGLAFVVAAGLASRAYRRVSQAYRRHPNPLRQRFPMHIAEQCGVQFVTFWPRAPLQRGRVAYLIGLFQNATDADRHIGLHLEEGRTLFGKAGQLHFPHPLAFRLAPCESGVVIVPFLVRNGANDIAHLHVSAWVEPVGDLGRRHLPWRAPHSPRHTLAEAQKRDYPRVYGVSMYRGRPLSIEGEGTASGGEEALPETEFWAPVDPACWPS